MPTKIEEKKVVAPPTKVINPPQPAKIEDMEGEHYCLLGTGTYSTWTYADLSNSPEHFEYCFWVRSLYG